MSETNEWIVIKSKKCRNKIVNNCNNKSISYKFTNKNNIQNNSLDCNINENKIFDYLIDLSIKLNDTILYDIVINSLISIINKRTTTIICLGIGDIKNSLISQFQFSLLLSLLNSNKLSITNILLYDPLFNPSEKMKEFLLSKNIIVLNCNNKGKYTRSNDEYTVFYMPHCPYQLYNNVLWSNWKNLKNISIIGNSFSSYELRRTVINKNDCMTKLYNLVTEIDISNDLSYHQEYKQHLNHLDVSFNDLSIHYFSDDKLMLASSIELTNSDRPPEDVIDELTLNDGEVI